jgi:TrpR-related protein YerC/YecD
MTAEIAPTRDERALVTDLCRALLAVTREEEAEALLRDLCTPAEIRTLAERWHVARLLDSTDLSYRDIHDGTGVSTTTIVRVARFLRQEPHKGYRAVLDRLETDNAR